MVYCLVIDYSPSLIFCEVAADCKRIRSSENELECLPDTSPLATVYFRTEGKTAWWIGAFRLLCRQARTWRAGHQTRGKGSCGDEGRGAGPQTSHLPPLLPRGLQGMGTLPVPSPKLRPSHPPPPILSVRSVYWPGASTVWPWWPFLPPFSPTTSIIWTPAPESVSFPSCLSSLLSSVMLLHLGFNSASKNIFSIRALR